MYCVQKFLLDNHISPYSRDPDQPIQKASSHLTSPTLESQPFHNSILPSPSTDPSFKAWRQDAEAANGAANGASPANHFLPTYGRMDRRSRLKKPSWRPFRRLGSSIRDQKRMCVLELMDVPGEMLSSGGPYKLGFGIRMSPGHMGFTWRSIEQWERSLTK